MQNDESIGIGDLSVLWQHSAAHLRRISVNGIEVLRGIYIALRDPNWGTVPASIQNYQQLESADKVMICFNIRWKQAVIDFEGDVSIELCADGSIDYAFSGVAKSSFQSNRIGFLVLHPAELGGQKIEVEHTDGSIGCGVFPETICPDQPFCDIRSIRHWAGAYEVETRMSGDTFEMEDQRNWTDASFKTYCTPLRLPIPKTYHPGERVEQRVKLSVKAVTDSVSHAVDGTVEIKALDRSSLPLPSIGFALPAGVPAHPRAIVERLKLLRPDHVRVDLKLGTPDWMQHLKRAVDVVHALETSLEIATFCSDAAATEWADLAREVDLLQVQVARWLVFAENEKSTPGKCITLAREAIHRRFKDPAPLVAGTDAFFAELNREPPSGNAHDAVTFSINPQVHAFDDLSLLETLAVQKTCVETAAEFSRLPVCVSPVTLKMRWNPNTTGNGSLSEDEQYDPRIEQPFASVWTLGSIKFLAEAGTVSVTFFSTLGKNGVLSTKTKRDGTIKLSSRVRPMEHTFALLAKFKGYSVQPCVSSDPMSVLALLLQRPVDCEHGPECVALFANVTHRRQTVHLRWGSAEKQVSLRAMSILEVVC